MGSFLTNCQVRTTKEKVDAIAKVMIRVAKRDGFVVADAASDDVARHIFIVASKNSSGWITVCDSDLESQNGDELLAMAKALSKAVGDAALGIAVSDSDVVQLHYCSKGRHVDSFSNVPDYGEMTDNLRAKLHGRPKRWEDVLAVGSTLEQIDACWQSRPVFVEEMVAGFCRLLAIDSDNCLLDASAILEDQQHGFELLRHIRLQLPGSMNEMLTQHGPTELNVHSSVLSLHGTVGESLLGVTTAEGIHWGRLVEIENRGESSTGITVTISGPAIDHGLLLIDKICILSTANRVELVPELIQLSMGSNALNLKLPEYKIPAGIDIETRFKLSARLPIHQWLEQLRASTFTVAAHGTYRRVGNGTLDIAVAPLSNATEGSTRVTISVSVNEDRS